MGDAESVQFTGGLTANARIAGHTGWRGPGKVIVHRAGVEFCLGAGFRGMGDRYVVCSDLAYVYPVKARTLSLTSLVASIIPSLSNVAVRFVTQPAGVSADRDDYIFFSYRHEEWKLIDILEELGYPIDRKLKKMRLYWQDEV